jgi:Secretion system C-terminal sorting domain/The GLUG motif
MKHTLLLLTLTLASLVTQAQTYSGGAGTVANPYLIANKTDLNYLSQHPTQWAYNYQQTANINFTSADFATGGAFYNTGLGFRPIGEYDTLFTGTYNGNHFVIDSLIINRPNADYVALFGNANYATLTNIGLTHATIAGYLFVGALAGSIANATISNCYATGSVTGDDAVGGLIGAYNKLTLTTSYASVNVAARINAGGLIGYLITYFPNNSIVANCYATGTVNGYNAGGLIGRIDHNGSYVTLTNCYAKGAVQCTGAWCNAGGIVGDMSLATGATLTNCFWDTQTTGQATGTAGTGYPTTLMQQPTTYTGAGWDFKGETTNGTADLWQMPCTNGYPLLAWQVPTGASATYATVVDSGCGAYTWAVNQTNYTASGNYTHTLTNSHGCDSVITLHLTINNLIPDFITIGDSISSIAIANDPAASAYQWVNCDAAYAPVIGATGETFIIVTNGNYALIVRSGACIDTSACLAVTDIITGERKIVVGVLNNVMLYPNPSAGAFTIALPIGTQLYISNMLGQQVYSATTNATTTAIDLSHVSSGMYNVRCVTGNTVTTLKYYKY